MRILVVNVNTTDSITQAIARQAQSVAAPGTEIIGLTPGFGAESVEGNFESYLAAIAVMDCVMWVPCMVLVVASTGLWLVLNCSKG